MHDLTLSTAAHRFIESLRTSGRLEEVDVALVVGFQVLAETLENEPTNPGLWREFRQIEQALRATGAAADDDLAALLRQVVDTPST